MSLPFLLEIGTEEIPDWMIERALNQLELLFREKLHAARLDVEHGFQTEVHATPRRLALRAGPLPEQQLDTHERKSGPPVAAAFKDGQPTAAALGFARSMGLEVSQLKAEDGKLVGEKRVPGRRTAEILAEALPGIILGLQWPKAMYWTGKGGPRFIRPIRWLVALLGGDVVPFELAGVRSGNVTSGHRRLGASRIEVEAASYDQRLSSNGVLVSAAERRAKIEREIGALLEGTGLRVKPDPDLLDTLVYMTEFPTPILGSFDSQYLSLPEEVLVTVMRHHQRYFSLEDAGGKLAPRFIAVMNTNADPEGLVRQGNDRVLRARFNDARFFWEVDQHKRLDQRLQDLLHVTFQAQLGSYFDKAKRMVKLARRLEKVTRAEKAHANTAALLAKCDLTCEMVKEFPELQGVMGGLYARAEGAPEEIWRAIYEHYKPTSMEDSIPSTLSGQIVALADKLDTLVECFRIGLVPTGSRDPLALRRAAQGVVRILIEGKLAVPLSKAVKLDAHLSEFFQDRVKYYLREIRGFRYDEVNAVVAVGWDEMVDLESRALAIREVRPTENFEPLAASFKRIKNILRQAEFAGGGEIDEALLEQGPERELYEAFRAASRRVAKLRKKKEYRAALETIAALQPKVDLFFDKVLVNAPDVRVRQNRLSLLHKLLTEFSAIADFSEIVTAQ